MYSALGWANNRAVLGGFYMGYSFGIPGLGAAPRGEYITEERRVVPVQLPPEWEDLDVILDPEAIADIPGITLAPTMPPPPSGPAFAGFGNVGLIGLAALAALFFFGRKT